MAVTSVRSRGIQCAGHSTSSELRQNALKSIQRFRGRVAQLAEHLLCKQGVGGSSPPTSTKTPIQEIVLQNAR